MKKSAFPAALLLLGVVLSGCPVYEGDDGSCFGDSDCAYGYACDASTHSCVSDVSSTPNACRHPSDCGTNETCSRSGTCVSGDCHFSSTGCVHGYACSGDSGRWECVASGSAAAGGAPNAGASPGGDSSTSDGGTQSTAGAGG